LRNPRLAFGEILLLWVSIAVTVWRFKKVSQKAAWLLLPYWVWTSFAMVLNLTIWQLNP
jgi:tryptophan-rich sensory protein